MTVDINSLEIKRPPYPVYKSFIVPYWENGLLSVREVGKKDVEEWREVLKLAKEFVKQGVERLGVKGEARLELVSDLLVLFFKVPLLREPISLLPSPLKAYLAWQLVGESRLREFRENPIQFARELYEVYRGVGETGRQAELLKIAKELEELLKIVEEARERVERCWFHLPADTRPVANCAGLIPHLLTTSALSWALAVQEGMGRREAALIRLSALLHDVGKPFAPTEHAEYSAEIAEWFTDFLDLGERKEIVKLVKDHHKAETEGGKIISEADGWSSATDRISGYLQEIVSERLGRKPELQEVAGWDFWVQLEKSSPDFIKSLSEEFVKRVRRETEDEGNPFVKPLPPPCKYEYGPIEEIGFGCIDLGGIQRFIQTPAELKAVAACSYVIETAVWVHIPVFLRQRLLEQGVRLPLEAFLYSGGGNLYLVFPERLKEQIESAVGEYTDVLRKENIPLELRVASVRFTTFFPDLLEQLSVEMGRRKMSPEGKVRVEESKKERCKCCFIRAPEPGEEYCGVCGDLIELGEKFHFRERWETEISLRGKGLGSPHQIFGKSWEEASESLMEIIAGHDMEEIEEGVERRNYAVLKVDGVCMGAFMASAISITDACERSARIDISLKRAFEDSAYELYTALGESEARKAIASLELGLLYMGGDDSLALMSSWYAPIFAHSVASKFSTYMGEVRGLSAGLAAGSAKAPVWSLINAADGLEKEAKKGTREEVNQLEGEAKSTTKKKVSQGAICYDVCEVPLSSTAVRHRRKELEERKITFQPFPVENGGKLAEILEKLSGGRSTGEWYRWALETSRRDGETKRLAKKVRECIREAVGVAKRIVGEADSNLPDEVRKERVKLLNEVSKLYMRRQQVRLEKRGGGEEWKRAVEACAGEWGKAAFGDVELLIKFALGGIT